MMKSNGPHYLKSVYLSLILGLGLAPQASPQTPLENNQPSGLMVDLLSAPDQVFKNGYPVNTALNNATTLRERLQFVEIARREPFFGWIVNSDQNNTVQVAYQIVVASSLQNIHANIGDYWDSGKVPGDRSANVPYKGKALKPDSVYFWKVKTWDNHGVESSFSPVQQFKTASTLSDYATTRYPIRKQDVYPSLIKPLGDSAWFADFGKAAFGTLHFTLLGKISGDTVVVHLGEALSNGRINRNPGGTIRYARYIIKLLPGWNTYQLVIAPDKRNKGPQAIRMPDYIGEVFPFRYCEIENYREPLRDNQLVQETAFYPFNENESYFHSSDSVLNQVWNLCKYSIKATSFTGVYIDGDRERIPYEADAYINQLGHYGVAREYSIGRYSHEYLINHPTWPTEWILQSVLMAWNDYLYTGNKASLRYFYNDLKAKALLPLAGDDELISTQTGKTTQELLNSIHFKGTLRDIVDWPQSGILGLGKQEPGETDGFVFAQVNTVVNAYHYRAVYLLEKIAEAIGESNDAKYFSRRASKIKDSFNKKLFDKKRGVYIDGIGTEHASLHANMFPMAFGLVPEKVVAAVSRFIESREMGCSVYGSQFLLDAIYESHNDDYGLKLLSSQQERSWYNMIRCGSTITFEAWDNKYKPNQDWNHAWGAAPANIIPRKLMGIEPLEPGFKKILLKPQPGDLRQAEIKCPTIAGDVFMWFDNHRGKSFSMKVSIPANTTADVYLPWLSKKQKVTMNGEPVKFKTSAPFIVLENMGSGSYEFNVAANN
jgi:hypothetical protein